MKGPDNNEGGKRPTQGRRASPGPVVEYARNLIVWRTPDGERALTPGEWSLARVGLARTWEAVEGRPGVPALTGVRVFDALQPSQQVALLALVGRALADPTASTPPLTAVTEGALAAVFAMLRAALDQELEDAGETKVRCLILDAVGEGVRDVPLPAPTEPDPEEWELLIEEVEERLFWDADFDMADTFLDLPPDARGRLLTLQGIDPDYFAAATADPVGNELNAVRRTLAELTGRRRPGTDCTRGGD
jgi:hypothetical protein